MEEIPGSNNDNSQIDGEGFDNMILLSANPSSVGERLDASRYHRSYKLAEKDAMGVETTQRSFSDRLYVAMNNQDDVVGLTLNYISGKGDALTEQRVSVKVSYALPLEVVFMTPLAEWNPYDISHKDDCDDVKGSGTLNDPYDASCPERFFRTPQKVIFSCFLALSVLA